VNRSRLTHQFLASSWLCLDIKTDGWSRYNGNRYWF